MSDTIKAKLVNVQQAHYALNEAYRVVKPYLIAGHRYELTIKPETRSTAANARMWAMLADIARQVEWHGKKLTPIDWKVMATAALKRQRVVPGIDGGFVVLGEPTSTMTKAEMSELQTLMEAFGAEHGVRFSAPEYEDATA